MRLSFPLRNTSSTSKPSVRQQHNTRGRCTHNLEDAYRSSNNNTETSESIWSRLVGEVKSFFLDIAEAFDAPLAKETMQQELEQQKLSAVVLRRDLKRCSKLFHPAVEVAAGVYDTLLWKHPLYTLLLVLVYAYSIVRGWTVSLVLLLLWTQLSLNYLKAARNVDIGLYFLPRKAVTMPKFDISGAQLVLDVAKKAQDMLNFAANVLEKVHSLMTWENRRVTFVFYCLVIYWLILSLVFNIGTCLGMCGFTIGVRIFITTYLFERFPRLRKRLDIYGWFYRNLPLRNSPETSPSSMVQRGRLSSSASESDSYPSGSNSDMELSGLHSSLNSNSDSSESSAKNSASENPTQNFHEDALRGKHTSFGQDGSDAPIEAPSLSVTLRRTRSAELPHQSSSTSLDPARDVTTTTFEDDANKSSTLSTYSADESSSAYGDPMIDNILASGNCLMNDKDKLFPKGILSGTLYLTDSALIFRSKSASVQEAVAIILLTDMTTVKKARSLVTTGLLVGTRKSLEIGMEGKRKPFQFIGLAQRDKFYARLQALCERGAHIQFL